MNVAGSYFDYSNIKIMKKLFYFANLIISLVAGADFFVWGVNLPNTTVLWHNGQFGGYFLLSLLTIVIAGFCLLPSVVIYDWE